MSKKSPIICITVSASKELICMKVKVKLLSHIRLFVTPWTVAHEAPPSMGLSRQDWSGLPFPSPGDLPDPGMCVKCYENVYES